MEPDWVTHQIAAAADAAGVKLGIERGYGASRRLPKRDRITPALSA